MFNSQWLSIILYVTENQMFNFVQGQFMLDKCREGSTVQKVFYIFSGWTVVCDSITQCIPSLSSKFMSHCPQALYYMYKSREEKTVCVHLKTSKPDAGSLCVGLGCEIRGAGQWGSVCDVLWRTCYILPPTEPRLRQNPLFQTLNAKEECAEYDLASSQKPPTGSSHSHSLLKA